jgi:hypothetical protein
VNSVSTNMTVADYCAGMDRREIIVNRDYQRSDKVWPDSAKSYLIESAILGYPIPKLFLYQSTDLKSRKTIKEIVDGQQRSMAIYDFFHDRFNLAGSLDTEELRGKTYSQLDPDLQQKFLDFSLSIDLFVSGPRGEVVEVFRRMNSYTIPLNPEEHRHSSHQGGFKWFINRISKQLEPLFLRIGLFSEKQLVRMADTKFLAELCDALLSGIRTTNRAILDRLYEANDKVFPEENYLEKKLTDALDRLAEWPEAHNPSLMKPYILYALVLAIIHVQAPVDVLEPIFTSPRMQKFDKQRILANLSALADALQNPEESDEFKEFIDASSSKTNVRLQREIRFRWMCKALVSKSL